MKTRAAHPTELLAAAIDQRQFGRGYRRRPGRQECPLQPRRARSSRFPEPVERGCYQNRFADERALVGVDLLGHQRPFAHEEQVLPGISDVRFFREKPISRPAV